MQPLTEEPSDDRASDALAAARRERRRAFWGEVVMTVALVPFVFAAAPFSSGGVVGWAVFANGVLTHGGAAMRLRPRVQTLFEIVDVLTNVGCVLYVNATTHWQPGTALITAVAALVWAANGLWYRIRYVIAHVVGVQWTLCFLLYVDEYRLF